MEISRSSRQLRASISSVAMRGGSTSPPSSRGSSRKENVSAHPMISIFTSQSLTIEDGTVTEGCMVVRYPNGQLVALHDVHLDTEEEALEYFRRKERDRRGSGRGLRAA